MRRHPRDAVQRRHEETLAAVEQAAVGVTAAAAAGYQGRRRILERHAPIWETITWADGRPPLHRPCCRTCSRQIDCSLGEWPCDDYRDAMAGLQRPLAAEGGAL